MGICADDDGDVFLVHVAQKLTRRIEIIMAFLVDAAGVDFGYAACFAD